MRSLELLECPDCLQKQQKSEPTAPWQNLDHDDRRTVRQRLIDNQNSICVWCERSITKESSSIEHLISRDQDPRLTFEISNLTASCRDSHTCNSARGNKTLPEWIHPYKNKTLQKNFAYEADGKISSSAACEHPDEAEITVTKTLELNGDTLKDTRARTIAELCAYVEQDFTLEEIIANIYNHKFTSVIEQWFEIHSKAL